MNDELRIMVDLRDRVLQKNRVSMSNRVHAIESGADSGNSELAEQWLERFAALEAEADKDIAKMVKPMPIVQEMVKVKGIGPMMAAKIVSMIDIRRAESVSALWRYAGYAVMDGEREKPTKGEKLHYNKRLKSTMYLVAGSFLKSNSPYRAVYDRAREYYAANRPDWTAGHQHNAAMRKMIKFYLAHLWEIWRQMEGLPVRNLYAIDNLGHTHYEPPAKYGWEAALTD
jgi:hypothetical protein